MIQVFIVRFGPTPWVSSRTVSTCSSIAQVRSPHSQRESCNFSIAGLLAGLVATVITKWRANDKYSYGEREGGRERPLSDLGLCLSGYVRAETLAGFINGLFLLFISFFIFSEAVERLVEPPEVKHERLLVVSVLGFLVNMVGIFVFQHGGAGHGHSHDGGHGHSHDGGHGHSHGGGGGGHSQIMKGVFLHILADTLGSVGVIGRS